MVPFQVQGSTALWLQSKGGNSLFFTTKSPKIPGTHQPTTPGTNLPTIFSRCSLKDINNADEFELCFQYLPKRTLHLKGEKCSAGREHSKVCITGVASGNTYGERISTFVQNFKKPRVINVFKTQRFLKAISDLRTKTRSPSSSPATSSVQR